MVAERSRWSMELLPLPRGGTRSEAVAINEAGHVVGRADAANADGSERSPSHAVVWRGGRVVDLGTLGLGGGLDMPNASEAVAVNGRGQVIGRSWVESNDPVFHAFVWRAGVMSELPSEQAVDIDAHGRIVLRRGRRAFVWDDGELTDVGALRAGGATSAVAINDRGQVVGASGDHAFLWFRGRMRDLGTLGGRTSYAVAINERGQVVGTSTTRSGDEHAFLWSQGRMRDLGALRSGGLSEAVDVNEHGQVLGLSFASYDARVAGGSERSSGTTVEFATSARSAADRALRRRSTSAVRSSGRARRGVAASTHSSGKTAG